MLDTIYKQQKKLYDQGLLSPYALAETSAIIGNKREALQYLRDVYNKRADSMMEVASNPTFTNLHSEPEYRDLMANAGAMRVQ